MKPLIPNTPHVIIMVGIPGAGKTTFAQNFAKTFHAPYINPRSISDLTGIDDEATERVTKLLFDELLKTRHTLIYEGSTFAKVQREALEQMITKAGYKPLLVWVQTDPFESKRRATKKGPGLHPISASVYDELVAQFQNPSEKEKPVVISGKHTFTTQLRTVLKRLAGGSQPNAPQPPQKPEPPRPERGRSITVR